nr:homoserine O-acetyltransferase [Luteibacter sp. Sphag1AF]
MAVVTAEPCVHTLHVPGTFHCERGGVLHDVVLTYSTYGQMSPSGDNVVWILHPLTCNAQPMDWWPEFVGPGKAINADEHFIVCVNSLGSCYGSTGPDSINPATDSPYHTDFPLITLKDVVALHEQVRAHLRIEAIHLGIGGSYGGQQLMEWMCRAPDLFAYACVIGAGARQSPWAVALNETQRMAMESDSTFGSGNEGAGQRGLAAARSLAVMSYRSQRVYNTTQAEANDEVCDGYRASSYQRHIGNKFTRRFSACAYWTLTKAMDSHNVGRGRGSIRNALAAVRTRVLFVALQDDLLFPVDEVRGTADMTPGAQFAVIDSDYGHDSILTHARDISLRIVRFIADSVSREEALA